MVTSVQPQTKWSSTPNPFKSKSLKYASNSSTKLVPSDTWRDNIPMQLYKENLNSIDEKYIDLSDKANWTTSLSACPNAPFFFVGSGNDSNNLLVYENQTLSKNSPESEKEKNDLLSFKLKSVFNAPEPIKDLSVCNSMLLTAGPSGCVQIFDLDIGSLGRKGQGLSHIAECRIGHTDLMSIPIAPPGSMISRSRITSVDLQPTLGTPIPSCFLAVQGKIIHIWDLVESKISCSAELAVDCVTMASWSPHQPLVCATSTDGLITILDTKNMSSGNAKGTGLAWKVEKAHQGMSVQAAYFNPFVPYWLGSAGSDGVIKVWDIRYLKNPACWIDAHYDSINDFAWSNTHCDRIMSISNDQNVRVWQMSASVSVPRVRSKDYLVDSRVPIGDVKDICIGANLIAESQTSLSNPLISVCTSPTHSDCFYSLSSGGDLLMSTINTEALLKTVGHKYDQSEYPEEYEIEKHIHQRNLTSAYRQIAKISKKNREKKTNILMSETDMIHLCTSKPAISSSSWSIPAVTGDQLKIGDKNMIEKMESDLDSYCYGLPPRFSEMGYWYKMIPTNIRIQFESIGLRYNLLYDIKKGNSEAILASERVLYTCLEADPTLIDGSFIMRILHIIMNSNYIKGLELGINICDILQKNSTFNFSNITEVVHMLLYPTSYDTVDLNPKSSFLGPDSKQSKLDSMNRWFTVWTKDEYENLINKQVSKMNSEERKIREMFDILSESKIALPMLQLERAIQMLLLDDDKNDDIIKMEIVKTMEDTSAIYKAVDRDFRSTIKSRDRTVSQHTNVMYLQSLISLRKFEEFFFTAMEFTTIYQSTPLPQYLASYIEKIAINQLESFLDEKYNTATLYASEAVKSAAVDPPRGSNLPQNLSSSLQKAHNVLLESTGLILKIAGSICTVLDARGVASTEISNVYSDILQRISGLLEQMTLSIFRLYESIQVMNPNDPLYRTVVTSMKDQVAESMKLFNSTNIIKESKQLSSQRSTSLNPIPSWVTFYLDAARLQEKLGKLISD